MKYFLHIVGPYTSKTVEVTGEMSIGRTDRATVVADDPGLSRVNTTFFIDEGELLVADENSTNGTFLNGDRIVGRPRILRDGDELKIGTGTRIRIEIADSAAPKKEQPLHDVSAAAAAQPSAPTPRPIETNKTSAIAAPPRTQFYLILASAAMTVLILLFGGLAIYLLVASDGKPSGGKTPVIFSTVIPVRVIDPLGGEDEDDLDDLIASWETAEQEIKAEDVADITSADAEEEELNVTAAFLAEQQRKAFEPRAGETGIRPAGLAVPKELFGDGVIKQKAKLREMNSGGYRQPMDFADLAEKRLSRELIEMPMATESFYLDVGGSAQDAPFSSFAFPNERAEITNGHPKFASIARLAENFAGRKYDLNTPGDRKQMRMRLLRMFQPRAKPILKELSDAYHSRFGRPLRVTSLTRSMDYQILLNAGNANSFKVRGEGSLPPHTSGCAFDLARKHMPAEEQNFVMAKLAEMERDGKLDALIEYGLNACFHVFIYHDGNPPRAFYFGPTEYETIPLFASLLEPEHDH